MCVIHILDGIHVEVRGQPVGVGPLSIKWILGRELRSLSLLPSTHTH